MELETAVSDGDYEGMQTLMADPIGVGVWRSEWRSYTPAQMVEEFQSGSLPAPTAIQFTGFSEDELTQLLGQPPASMLGPNTDVVAVLHSTGWGPSATDEAILFVVEEDGQYSWTAFLYTNGAFAEPVAEMFPYMKTDVALILALQDVVMYSGPGETYDEIGGVFDGQQAAVTGQSPDGGWWRVICPDDTVGDCWVTADPAFTNPVGSSGS